MSAADPLAHREGDGRVHLGFAASRREVEVPPGRRLGARWLVIALVLGAAALWAAAYAMPWWRFTLFAPQYPKGLTLEVALHGLGGDVREIDMLNHYIGMKHLGDAAQLERRLAGWAVGALGIFAMLAAVVPGRRGAPWMAIVGAAFPIGFVADSFYWLWSFGHALDPRAPLRMKPFTPQLFGEGVIGQFHTWAAPDRGFWLAVAAIALLAIAGVVRSRVCASCGRRGSCGALCPSLLVGPGAGLPAKRAG